MNNTIRLLKEYKAITGVSNATIARQTGFSRYTIVQLTLNKSIDFRPDTLMRINEFLDRKLNELSKFKKENDFV